MNHEVWAAYPEGGEPVFFDSYSKQRWQWAEKLARLLRDKGFRDVEVRTVKRGIEEQQDNPVPELP